MFIPTFVFLKFSEVPAPPPHPFQNPAYATVNSGIGDLKIFNAIVMGKVAIELLIWWLGVSSFRLHLDTKKTQHNLQFSCAAVDCNAS